MAPEISRCRCQKISCVCMSASLLDADGRTDGRTKRQATKEGGEEGGAGGRERACAALVKDPS